MPHESQSNAAFQSNGAVDLSNCAREPIHIPGLIQPHGLLLVLDEDGLIIRQASENSLELVNIPPGDLVDHSLDEFLGPDQCGQLWVILQSDDLIRANPLKLRLPDRPEGRAFNVLVHRVDGEVIFEAEPIQSEKLGDFQSYYHDVLLATTRIQTTESEGTLCQVAADEVRRIIGYDRVMVYRFDADWNGQVIAESRDDRVATSYLGLHFPASDIPEQARRLFTINRVRCIPDVGYTPIGLFRGGRAFPDSPLDMSRSGLRSVSPMHLEYLRNMGVGATLTVSLRRNGKLWGLVACHHYQPRLVCPERRLTCAFLGQIIEAQLNIREEGAERAYRVRTSAIQVRFLDLLTQASSLNGLAKDPTSVLDFVDAQGAAIVEGMKCTLLGQTPDEAEIPGLIYMMISSLDQGVYATNSLSASYSRAANFKDVASGMLGLEISRERGHYLLWFRPEVVRTVNWAGNPEKPVIFENGTARLHPRKSFDRWKKSVTNQSLRWKPGEVAAVIELSKTFSTVMAGKEELRARDRRQNAVTELGRRALASTDTQRLFRDTVELVAETLRVEICRVFHTLPDQEERVIRADHSPPESGETWLPAKPSDDPLAGFTMSSGDAVVVNDLRTESRFDGHSLHDLLGAVSAIAVPLTDLATISGVMIAYALRSRPFDQKDVYFLQLIADILTSAVQRKQFEENLEHQSRHDGLTGLPNRFLFMERLAQAIQNIESPPSILLIDLDRFKQVNDTLGHHFGDLLLQQAAARFRDLLRTVDTVARLGGDEFVVLLPRTSEKDAVGVAQRIRAALKRPFLLEDRTCEVGGSIGIAIAPGHGDDPNTLMRRADAAMYAAKRSGGGFAVYSADQDQSNPECLDLAGDLRAAIEANGLFLHYQPKINLVSRQLEAVEALARWFHPRDGMIPPSRFIPMAEDAGMMGQLERWALNQAIDQRRRWRDQGLDLGISVNISPRFLHNSALYETIVGRVSRLELPLTWLTLEITEGTLMPDPKGAIKVLTRLRGELGLKISIDDFGIGYSSLAYLRRLPVDELKIDREFVKDMITSAQDKAIVKTVIDLGHKLGLKVVAEGVEDRDTLELLATLDCDQAQGYFVSRPIPPEDLADLAILDRSAPHPAVHFTINCRVPSIETRD
jgi:diguanylate cyclase (GGDEF)-like protein